MASTYLETGAVPSGYEHALVSWRSIVAGLFITALVFMILMSLGVAVGGMALNEVVEEGSSAQGVGIGAGVWLVLSVLISLFAGSYFAGSVSSFVSRRSGIAHGLTIAAIFFVFMMVQTGAAIGMLASGVGAIIGKGASVAADQAPSVRQRISQSQIGQDLQNRIIRDLNLQSPPEVVAQGVASRVIQGDTEGAKNYLAQQAGITPEEADARINEVRDDVQAGAKDVGETATAIASGAGWSLFIMLVLGTLSAILGGLLGSRALVRSPVAVERRPRFREPSPAGV